MIGSTEDEEFFCAEFPEQRLYPSLPGCLPKVAELPGLSSWSDQVSGGVDGMGGVTGKSTHCFQDLQEGSQHNPCQNFSVLLWDLGLWALEVTSSIRIWLGDSLRSGFSWARVGSG